MTNNTKKILFWISTTLFFGCLIWLFIAYPWTEINSPLDNLKKVWIPLCGIIVGQTLMKIFNYKV